MEKSHFSECHYHIVLVSTFDNCIVSDRTAGLCDVAYAAAVGSFDVIREGEESVGAEGDA